MLWIEHIKFKIPPPTKLLSYSSHKGKFTSISTQLPVNVTTVVALSTVFDTSAMPVPWRMKTTLSEPVDNEDNLFLSEYATWKKQ